MYTSISYTLHINTQAMHATKEGEECLLEPDKDGNTIAHLAVEKGYVTVFKVCIFSSLAMVIAYSLARL